MGIHIAWFDSLSKTRQYDLLFLWMRRRASSPAEVTFIKSYFSRKTYKKYPAKLKYFIIEMRASRGFRPTVMNYRESVIDLILK